MPYPVYTKMTREDALDIRAYLQTIDPAPDNIEPNQLPFPFNIRSTLIVWNALKLHTRTTEAGSLEIRAVEPRTLSRRCAWPLRHVPYAKKLPRCRQAVGVPPRRSAGGLVRAKYHA